MKRLAVVVVISLGSLGALGALAAPAVAARHKILVLPVEGTADAATRGKLTAGLARLARSLDGQVATGSATFADTALAVGCDPRAPGCSDEVMATLGVDELVWGTAMRSGGQVRLIVRRAVRGATPREVSTVFTAGDPEDRITAGIAPVFAPPGTAPEPPRATPPLAAPAPAPSAAPAAVPPPTMQPAADAPGEPPPTALLDAQPATADDRRDRTRGIALAAAGGGSLVLGLALWSSYASLQDQIDHHAVRTPADFRDLKSLEDTASTRAIAGDIFVVAGLVAGGFGAYYLVRDHRRHAVIVAPAAIPGGGGVTITLIGGP